MVLSLVPLKRGRAELHIGTKNKAVGADILSRQRLWPGSTIA